MYEIWFAKPVSLNWLLNEKITVPSMELTGSFVSRARNFTGMRKSNSGELIYVGYPSSVVYTTTWANSKWRTLEFSEEPTGDMLAWLEQNGVPQ